MSDPVINVSQPLIDNRHRSGMQKAICAYLKEFGDPAQACHGTVQIGHLPTTGDVVDALGLQRSKSTFASVSRSLLRLERAGVVQSFMSGVAIRGSGYRYALSRDEARKPSQEVRRNWHGKPMTLSVRPSMRVVKDGR